MNPFDETKDEYSPQKPGPADSSSPPPPSARSSSSSTKQHLKHSPQSTKSENFSVPRRWGSQAEAEPPLPVDDDEVFEVRDLLSWGNHDGRKRRRENSLYNRPGIGLFEVDLVTLFYTFCVFTLLAVAEITMKPYMEKVGNQMIVMLQKRGMSCVWWFDLVGFPPDTWGFMPGIAFTAVRSWRSVGNRMIILQGIGGLFKWLQNQIFKQGRPFWVTNRVEMWHCPTTYGFPSGHALLLLLCISPIIEALWYNDPNFFNQRPQHVGRCGRLTAFIWSFALVAVYSLCLVGRMYLGTHYFHSLLMGIVGAMLLLQVFSRHNVSILADRVMLSVEVESSGQRVFHKVIGAILRGVGTTVFLLGLVHVWLYLCTHFADPDPHIWTSRAIKKCQIAPATREGSLDKAYVSCAIIVGWITGLSLWALDPTAYKALAEVDPLNAAGKPRRKSKQLISPRMSYGTILEQEMKFQVAADQGMYSFLEDYGVNFWLFAASICMHLLIAIGFMFLVPNRPVGTFLAALFATYFFPRFFQPKMKKVDIDI